MLFEIMNFQEPEQIFFKIRTGTRTEKIIIVPDRDNSYIIRDLLRSRRLVKEFVLKLFCAPYEKFLHTPMGIGT